MRKDSNWQVFIDVINGLSLGLLLVIINLYWVNDSRLISIHNFVMPITDWVISPIFFVKWIVDVSNNPDLTHAYLVMVYFIFLLIFCNNYISLFRPFSGFPSRGYYLTLEGFTDFLEDHLYSSTNIPVSLGFLKYPSNRSSNKGEYVKVDTFKELIQLFFKKVGVQYFGFYIISGFLFFTWVAHDSVNSNELSILPFWLAVIIFCYAQVRFIFELLALLPKILFDRPIDA